MKTTYTKSRPETIFQLLTFTFDPFESSMSSGVILLERPYVSFSSPLLLILRREITAAAVALLYLEYDMNLFKNVVTSPFGQIKRTYPHIKLCISLIIFKVISNKKPKSLNIH